MAPRKKPKPRKLATTYERGPNTDLTTEPGFPFGGWLVVERYSRLPGAGSIDTVKRKGKEYLRWRGWGTDAKGVRLRKSLYATSPTALQKKIVAFQADGPKRSNKKLTIEDFFEHRFLPDMKQRLKYNTLATYKTAVSQYIVPDIGKVRLLTLKPPNVAAWLDDLKVGARSKQLAFATLRRGYSYAVELGLLDRSPLADMKAPRSPRSEQRILDLNELRKLLDVAKGTEWYPLIFLASVTAMREGELFGLTRDDLHLGSGYLLVTKNLARTENGLALVEPKTATSRRRVDLPKEAVKVLRDHLKRQPKNDLGLVFTTDEGTPLDGPNFLKRAFRPLLKKAELPAVRFHSLRHSSNTALAMSGVPLRTLQALLGHATSKTTMDVYSHHAPSEGKAAADLIGSLLTKRGTTRGTTGARKRSSRESRTKKKALQNKAF